MCFCCHIKNVKGQAELKQLNSMRSSNLLDGCLKSRLTATFELAQGRYNVHRLIGDKFSLNLCVYYCVQSFNSIHRGRFGSLERLLVRISVIRGVDCLLVFLSSVVPHWNDDWNEHQSCCHCHGLQKSETYSAFFLLLYVSAYRVQQNKLAP